MDLLGDRGVDNVHGSHGASGIVEYPILLDSPIGIEACVRVRVCQFTNQGVDDEGRIAAVRAGCRVFEG